MTFVQLLSRTKSMTSRIRLHLFKTLLIFSLISINGCHGPFIWQISRADTLFHGPIKVAIQEDLLKKSLEKDLISHFAMMSSIQVKFISFKNLSEAETLLSQEAADLVFTRSTLGFSDFKGHFTMAYDDLKLTVLCSSNLQKAKEIYIPERYLNLEDSKNLSRTFKDLRWVKTDLSNNKLFALAQSNNEICYLTDSRLAQKNKLINPKLHIAWTSQKPEAVAWVTRYDLKELNQLLLSWFQGLVRKNQIRKFWDQYEAFDFKMSILEQRRFQKDVVQNLPKWRKLFEKAAKENQIPWTLLAAVSYQESKWTEQATSYTGVRGLMQITSQTARHLGINDREDPEQSIAGGAYYLKYLYDKTPAKWAPYQRWSQALTAYNIGWAHLRDARNLALKMNKDPQRWLQFKTVLPLLSDENYASQLKFGPARGNETVEFVDQVFGYTELLNNSFTRRLLTSQDF